MSESSFSTHYPLLTDTTSQVSRSDETSVVWDEAITFTLVLVAIIVLTLILMTLIIIRLERTKPRDEDLLLSNSDY